MSIRPAVIAFDVVETLFSLESLARRFERIGLEPQALPLFFSRMLRDAFALETSGVYVPFRQVAEASLRVTISNYGGRASDEHVQAVLGGFSELEAHPDVREAIELVHLAEVRVFALTNGSAETTRRLIEKAGLSDFFEKILSIDAVRHWKPHHEVYAYAVREAGVDASRVALVAAHAWDTHGAKQAGLKTGWVRREEKEYSPAMSAPDAQGASLTEVVGKLLDVGT